MFIPYFWRFIMWSAKRSFHCSCCNSKFSHFNAVKSWGIAGSILSFYEVGLNHILVQVFEVSRKWLLIRTKCSLQKNGEFIIIFLIIDRTAFYTQTTRERAAWSVGNIAVGSRQYRRKLAANSIIPILTELLLKDPVSGGVYFHAFLEMLLYHSVVLREMVKGMGLEFLLRPLLRVPPEHERLYHDKSTDFPWEIIEQIGQDLSWSLYISIWYSILYDKYHILSSNMYVYQWEILCGCHFSSVIVTMILNYQNIFKVSWSSVCPNDLTPGNNILVEIYHSGL